MGFSWPKMFNRDSKPVSQVRRFDAASVSRRASGFTQSGPISTEVLGAFVQVRARARHAYQNNGYLRNAIGAIVAESVGSSVEANSAHPEAETRALIDSVFTDACQTIDIEGRTNFGGIQAAVVEALYVDGESFVHMVDTDQGLRLRILPAEFIDSADTRNLPNGRYVVSGVEFSESGQRVAYHVRRHRPTEVQTTSAATVRIDAADMLHIMRPLGAGQVRGMSALAPVLLTVSELDQLQDALLIGAKIAAMNCGFIIDNTDIGGSGALPEADSLTGEISLEPGVVRVLPAGTDIKFNSPDQAKDGVGFAKLTLGQIAAGLGVPQHLLDGDLTGANYSSLRAGLLPFRAKIEQLQKHVLIPQFLAPVFRRVIASEVLAGRLKVDLATALKADWLPPRPTQVDPQKDLKALQLELDLGLTSRRRAAASRGINIAQLDEELKADAEREADLNLSFSKDESETENV